MSCLGRVTDIRVRSLTKVMIRLESPGIVHDGGLKRPAHLQNLR
jgi:hypothetical protein